MNVDNFLGNRPSTRVHAPPGGRSSISFGGYEAPAPARRTTGRARVVRPTAASKAEERAVARAAPARAAAPAPKAVLRETNTSGTSLDMGKPAPVSSNAFASGSNQNCGNVMTGRSSTRLHAPPGGKSSFSLGWN